MRIYTAGYEGVDTTTFFYTMLFYGVDKIVDVREIPISRKKGFSKTAFGLEAEKRKIEYVHMKQLGCPKEIRHAYREHRDWKKYLDGFLPYLQSQKDELLRLKTIADQETICLVCFEADARFCHRSYVAAAVNELSKCSFDIIHLDPGSITGVVWQKLQEDKSHQQSTIDVEICAYCP